MLIEDIDFIDFAEYLFKVYGSFELEVSNFNNIADTYCGLKYGKVPSDNTNKEMIEIMLDLNLIKKIKTINGTEKYKSCKC